MCVVSDCSYGPCKTLIWAGHLINYFMALKWSAEMYYAKIFDQCIANEKVGECPQRERGKNLNVHDSNLEVFLIPHS